VRSLERSSRLVALGSALAVLSFVPTAWAHGASERSLPAEVPAVTPEGVEAKAELEALSADAATKSITSERVESGKRALARAHGAKLAGDEDGARSLSRVARAWARSARAAIEAAATEKRASAAEARARELEQKLARARSLLAETQARRGQLRAEIPRIEEAAKAARERTIEAERARGAKPGARTPKSAPSKPSTGAGR
jgi:chromosome segregation ATPase